MTPPNFNDLKSRAESGDARAQYELAASLSASGARDEAEQWLKKAAENGEPDAGYTLATRQLQTASGADEAFRLAAKAARNGSAAAQRLLAVLYAEGLGAAADWRCAVSLVIKTAKEGDAASMRELGMLLLLTDADAAGVPLLSQAAESDAIAAAVYVRQAILKNAITSKVKRLAQNLRRMRYPHADDLIAGIQNEADAGSSNAASQIDWAIISERLSDETVFYASSDASSETISSKPDAKVVRNAFSREACEYVIATASKHLAPSLTVDPRTGESRQDAYRTSLTATMGPVDLDLALIFIDRKIAALSGNPSENGEFISVLHYSAGQEYRPHFDWLPPGDDVDRVGQRVTTSLLYLNSDYEGGETHFLSPDIRFAGNPGDLLVFQNATPEGAPDKASRHASLPVTRGVKWIASKWFRGKKYYF